MCVHVPGGTEERNLSLQYLSVVLYPQLILNYEPDDLYKHPTFPAYHIKWEFALEDNIC